jgi:hypothetical protein
VSYNASATMVRVGFWDTAEACQKRGLCFLAAELIAQVHATVTHHASRLYATKRTNVHAGSGYLEHMSSFTAQNGPSLECVDVCALVPVR